MASICVAGFGVGFGFGVGGRSEQLEFGAKSKSSNLNEGFDRIELERLKSTTNFTCPI